MKNIWKLTAIGILVLFVSSCASYVPLIINETTYRDRSYKIVGRVSVTLVKNADKKKGIRAALMEAAIAEYGEGAVDDVVDITATRWAIPWVYLFAPLKIYLEARAIKYTDGKE